MNAQQLKDFLLLLEKDGNVLSEIDVNFRHDYESDVIPLRYINEDLFDKETNNKLISICLMHTEDDDEENNDDNDGENEEEEDSDDICWECNGSGEGMWDGSSCGVCGGSGVYIESNNI